tara:strand:+ start:1020 stop:2144 length:1125 start_codon:yes stop_codon:yes gene_type:complete
MSYLDSKEQVIDLKLTTYGKYLLSIGKLQPVFYAFFDDDIIYDSAYAGVSSEVQSEIEPRIQEETPRFQTQVNYSSKNPAIFIPQYTRHFEISTVNDLIIGESFNSYAGINGLPAFESAVYDGLVNVQNQPEKLEALQNSISFSNPNTEFAPSWNVAFLKAPLSSSVNHLSISSSLGEKFLNIPQLNANISYQVIKNSRSYNLLNAYGGIQKFGGPSDFVQAGAGQRTGEDAFLLEEDSLSFQNGASVDVIGDAIVLRIEESNLFFEEENFDIELFEIQEVSGKESLSQIQFYKDLDVLSSDLLNGQLNSNAAEKYFEILIDGEIPERLMCPLIQDDKSKQFYISKIFDCEDFIRPPEAKNIYADQDDTKDICS